jgi:hypothetical protein
MQPLLKHGRKSSDFNTDGAKVEHEHACPTEDHWQELVAILRLDSTFPKIKP